MSNVTPMPDQSTPRARVAAEVRAAMSRKRAKGVDAARALGMSQQSFSRRHTGELAFDVDELDTLARWLGVSAASFFGAPDTGIDPPAGPNGGPGGGGLGESRLSESNRRPIHYERFTRPLRSLPTAA